MTYSIVARDPQTGNLGVAVQSCWFSVGSVVTWAEAGVGAVATQSFVEPAYGPQGLALMRVGLNAATALQALVDADPQQSRRQVAFVDSSGRVAQHTGDGCIAHAGDTAGIAAGSQANMMRTADVWPAMLAAYERASGDLAERLLSALEAGEGAGGDVRGRQSAAMLIVSGQRCGQSWQGRLLDLRVDDSRDPLAELRRLVGVHQGYDRMSRAEEKLEADPEAALSEYQAARQLLPDNDEAAFWSAVLMAGRGRVDEGRALLAQISAREPGWTELLRRLPAAGLLPGGETTVHLLLG